eukprot:TRINITY_DN526_c0_g1_i8.p1 TRINITY_DN526_c0_g1~~TRINITY_DN526_c0_g1_i8.p1  ORF type:complete len:706 (+),score=233.11 TRINITY_DN526_c0_g1_i8:43-2160(+)
MATPPHHDLEGGMLPRATLGNVFAPRYTSMKLSQSENDGEELSGELWSVSGPFGVNRKKAWVAVNYQTRRLSMYSSYSRDHSKLLGDIDFKLIVKLFWFVHENPVQPEHASARHKQDTKPMRYWYFGLELVKEPGGIDRRGAEWGKATMRDRKSEVVIFATESRETYKRWEKFLSDDAIVKTTRSAVTRHEVDESVEEARQDFERQIIELTSKHEREMQAKDASIAHMAHEIETKYSMQLNDVITKADHDKQVSEYASQKKALQTRERQYQEGLAIAQQTVNQLKAEHSLSSEKAANEIARLEAVIKQQEHEKADLLRNLEKEQATVVILRKEVEDRILEGTPAGKDKDKVAELEALVVERDNQLKELRASNAALEQTISSLTASEESKIELENLKSENTALRSHIDDYTQQLSTSNDNIGQAAGRILELERQLSEVDSALRAEVPASDDLFSALEELITSRNRLLEAATTEQKQESDLRGMLLASQEKSRQRMLEIKDLQSELETAKYEATATAAEMERVKASALAAAEELAAARLSERDAVSRHAEASEALVKRTQELMTTEAKLAELQRSRPQLPHIGDMSGDANLQQLHREIKSLTAELMAAEQSKADEEMRADAAEEQYREAKGTIIALENKLSALVVKQAAEHHQPVSEVVSQGIKQTQHHLEDSSTEKRRGPSSHWRTSCLLLWLNRLLSTTNPCPRW